MQKTGGFTYIELKIVLCIMGLLLLLSGIGIAEYHARVKLRNAILSIDSDIRLARWTAKCSSNTCFIQFDTDANSYRIEGKQYSTMPDGIRFGIDPSVTGRPGEARVSPPPDGITFTSNTARFYPTGLVTPTGSIYLTNGKKTMAITVSITGRPRIWRSRGGSKWDVMIM